MRILIKGFCIEYDSKSILTSLQLNTNFFPVLYQDKLPKLPHGFLKKPDIGSIVYLLQKIHVGNMKMNGV